MATTEEGTALVNAPQAAPYMQNRELSWLTFNERVLDISADASVPLLERLNFVSIFWSNLQEFFMVRVGSLTDLSLVKKTILDSKSMMTPAQQIDAIHARCHELYPIQERNYENLRALLAEQGVCHLRPDDLDDEQRSYLEEYVRVNVSPFLSPQIVNSRHPFPHLENGALYVIVRLDEEALPNEKKPKKKDADKTDKADKGKDGKTEKAAKTDKKNVGAEGVTLGLVPMPRQCKRVIKLPGRGFQFILLEHAIEMLAAEIFSMYEVKHTNVVCVTRNADIDATESVDEVEDDYREHMKRILKKRSRLAPVRLESERPLSDTVQHLLLDRLDLKPHQVYCTSVPLDLSFTWGLAANLSEKKRAELTPAPFTPQWPASLDHNRRVIDQVCEREVLLSYPYESMDAFVQMLREAASDPTVVSIKITLYRLASQSHLAEALIAAAENGKEVTALFELRARFDESNNIEWSQRFEEAGCNVIYGFRDYKVHSKICCITRQTADGIQYITQLGTGNYNEKTAKLYTDFSFITTSEGIGRDATEFFRNMALENASDNYSLLWVAPLQIKPMILANIDLQIKRAQAGEPCGLFFKTNSVTDKDIIEKIVEASQAGVPVTMFVRGICCLVPGIEGYTDNVRVVSIVGRLLEHSRIYGFGPREDMRVYLSSADLMTRNMDKRVEIAWPILDAELREQVLEYVDTCLADTAKLRQLQPDKSYTPLGTFVPAGAEPFDAQNHLIKQAQIARLKAAQDEATREAAARRRMPMAATPAAAAAAAATFMPPAPVVEAAPGTAPAGATPKEAAQPQAPAATATPAAATPAAAAAAPAATPAAATPAAAAAAAAAPAAPAATIGPAATPPADAPVATTPKHAAEPGPTAKHAAPGSASSQEKALEPDSIEPPADEPAPEDRSIVTAKHASEKKPSLLVRFLSLFVRK